MGSPRPTPRSPPRDGTLAGPCERQARDRGAHNNEEGVLGGLAPLLGSSREEAADSGHDESSFATRYGCGLIVRAVPGSRDCRATDSRGRLSAMAVVTSSPCGPKHGRHGASTRSAPAIVGTTTRSTK